MFSFSAIYPNYKGPDLMYSFRNLLFLKEIFKMNEGKKEKRNACIRKRTIQTRPMYGYIMYPMYGYIKNGFRLLFSIIFVFHDVRADFLIFCNV